MKFKLEVAMDLPDIKEANSNLQHPAGTLVKPTRGERGGGAISRLEGCFNRDGTSGSDWKS